jgi:hypothetical protein
MSFVARSVPFMSARLSRRQCVELVTSYGGRFIQLRGSSSETYSDIDALQGE